MSEMLTVLPMTLTEQTSPEASTPPAVAAEGSHKLVSDSVLQHFELIAAYWIVFILSTLGIVTNCLTLTVFLYQGFKDSVNVSLFTIAFWDQIKCLSCVVFRMYGPVELAKPAWGAFWKNASGLYLIYLPIFAGYVSYGLATYVSVERCLSVSMPFKVKSLFTPRLTTGFMVVLSVVIFSSFSPMFFTYDIMYVFSPVYNATVVNVRPGRLYFAQDGLVLKWYKFLGIFYVAVFCTVMSISSILIVYHLRKSAANFDRFDKDKTGTSAGGATVQAKTAASTNARDVKVTKMLLVVILVYLMDFFPRLFKYTASLIEPEFFTFRKYHNLIQVISYTIWILDVINASVNFFIFMSMSTSFRTTFYRIFPICGRTSGSNVGKNG